MTKFGRGSKHSEESKAKMAEAHFGKKHSEETKAKMSKEKCPRGHLMSKTRKVYPNGETYCSTCKAMRAEAFRKSDAGKKRIKAYNRRAKLKSNYGMSESDFAALLKKQRGKCAICLRKPNGESFHVDHNHKTEEVRGILCHHCNLGLGLLQDKPEIIARALGYLENHADIG